MPHVPGRSGNTRFSRESRSNSRWPEAKIISVLCLAGAKLVMPASSSFCWHLLTKRQICWHPLTKNEFADVCWRNSNLLTFSDIWWRKRVFPSTKATVMLTSSDVCWRESSLLTFADEKQICWHLLTKKKSADICWTLPARMIRQRS